MKKVLLIPLLVLYSFVFGQAPSGYYNGTAGLSGSALKTKLSEIIANGHQDNGYSSLWSAYQTTDRDYHYENDGTILDYYSENPNGTDAYNYTLGGGQCGSYSGEGSCYNREHIVPQSVFNSNAPMKNDIHHVRATDGYVNNRRGSYPFGEVNNASWTSQNGSKVGSSNSSGYGGTVFEPIDEFKGDIARMVFYFVTRYENQLSGFSSGNMLGGSAYPGLQNWELQVLLAWHNQDPVSAYEIARNNASYTFQGNRNPYIDHPEWVNSVWNYSASPDTENPTAPTNLSTNNPTANSIDLSWNASTDNVGVTGYIIYIDNTFHSTVGGNTTATTITGLTPETTYQFYIKAKDAANNTSTASNTASETTLAGQSTGGTCGTEDFETIPANSSDYSTRTWTNNGITWTATNARTDQNINNRAIVIRKICSLTSSTISGGIQSLTVSTKRVYSGSSGTFDLIINGNTVGTIPYNSTLQTTTIDNINIEGDFTIEIKNHSNNTSKNRIAFDDLTWTCYNNLSTTDIENNSGFSIYPNPVKNGTIYYNGKDKKSIEWIKLYTMSGQLLKTIPQPFRTKNKIDVKELQRGLYLLQTPTKVTKFIVE